LAVVSAVEIGLKPFLYLLLEQREGRPNVGSLLVAFVVTFTVAGSVALGITAAYVSVIALLHAFASQSQKPRPAVIFVQSQHQVSGD
jgi:hypothetical protein